MGKVAFRLGRAGVGKSARIADEIAKQVEASPLGPQIYWIVPNDASFSTEKLLMRKVPSAIRCEILTLHRLAERLNQAMGIIRTTRVNTTGKRLLLAKVYRQSADHLSVLGRVQPSVGFLDAILEVFDELIRCQISIPQMESMLEAAAASVAEVEKKSAAYAGQSLIGKLRDLCILYIQFKVELDKHELCDSADVMSLVQPHLASWGGLRDATLYIDGFVDMTPQEQHFVLGLMDSAAESVVALSMDPRWTVGKRSDKSPLNFASLDHRSVWNLPVHLLQFLEGLPEPDAVYAPQTALLFESLTRGCDELGLQWSQETILGDAGSRYDLASDLYVMEQQLFNVPGQMDQVIEADNIRYYAAQNVRVEAEGVAREILKLVHRHQLAYRDIAVVVPNLEEYHSHLQESFEAFDIPYYADRFPSLSTHPLPKFLLASLQVVEDEFSTESVLRVLKSDFCGLKRDQADWLETYLTQYEVDHVRFWHQSSPWAFAELARDEVADLSACQREDGQAELLRRQFQEIFLPLYEALKSYEITPNRMADALWSFFGRVNAKRIMAEWMVDADAGQTPMEASLHEQVWQRVISLLSDLHKTSSEEAVPRSFLLQVVRSDIEQQTLTTIPAGVDEVIVTESHRARGWEAEIVFVMGATDGSLPRKVKPVGILQDEERDQFAWLFGQRLGYTAEEKQLCERSMVYSVLTRAKRGLVVSYPMTNAEGKEVRPTLTLGRIRTLFVPGTIAEKTWKGALDDFSSRGQVSIAAPRHALRVLIAAMREAKSTGYLPPYAVPIFQYYVQAQDGPTILQRGLRGFTHRTEAAELDSTLAQALYENPLKTNVHQLETFAACPFQHFVKHGLKVKEDQTRDTGAAAKGTLKHDVLLGFVEKHRLDVLSWKSMTDEEATESIRLVFEETLAEPKASIWARKLTRKEQAKSVLRELEYAAILLTRHARYGLFEPRAMELSFGGTSSTDLPGYEIPLSQDAKVILRGRVDRIDVATDKSRHAFRIIDYKSSQLKIDLTKVAHGLRLQLPIYAAVVTRYSEQLFGEESEPAGILYVPIVHKVSLTTVPNDVDTARELVLKNMRVNGLMVHDPTLVEWMDSRLTDPSGTSELFPKIFNKTGTLAPYAPVLSASEWEMLMGRALKHVRDMGERILSGDISIAPYQLGYEDACTWCSLAPVCHVEKRFDMALFRRLPKFSREDIATEWGSDSVRGTDA